MEVHFQEDILMDILTRLPVKSLLRFKCVSKFWKKLIDEPLFRMKHLNHAKNDRNLQKFLFYQLHPEKAIVSIHCCPLSSVQVVEDVHELNFPSEFEPWFCVVYCCCDDLVIIKVIENGKGQILLLWNPSTGESTVLPYPKFPMEGFFCLGMSFDSTCGDYKILKVPVNGNEGLEIPSEILTLKSGSWREIDEHPRDIYNMVIDMHSLPFIHGAFHWIGMSRNYFVVSFDISHEVYGEIPLPEEICLRNMNIGGLELDGMLCAYSNVNHHGNRTFKLWVMKDYGIKESWNVLLSMADPDICTPVPKYRFANGEVLLWCSHYRLKENAYRTQRGPLTLLPRGIAQNGFAFTESLIFPKLLT